MKRCGGVQPRPCPLQAQPCPQPQPCPPPKPCSLQKCPKCRTPCVSATKLGHKNSTIIFVNAPKELEDCLDDEDELKLQVWAGMEPPKISDPTPAVCPERLERVRDLLSDEKKDDAIATRIESIISLEIMGDGMVRRSHSRKEIKWFKRTGMEIDFGADDKEFCLPDCSKASEEEIKELFRKSNCQNIPTFVPKRCQ